MKHFWKVLLVAISAFAACDAVLQHGSSDDEGRQLQVVQHALVRRSTIKATIEIDCMII